jgi:aminobenzoyl-glutamate transport protein
VHAAANNSYMLVSTCAVTAVGTLVNDRLVEPLLGSWDPARADGSPPAPEAIRGEQRRAFGWALGAAALLLAGIALLALCPGSPLRDPAATGGVVEMLAPLFRSIEVLVAVFFFVPGVVYGACSGQVRSDRDVAAMLAESMATMGAYIALAFVAAQFVAYFAWTDLGAITAVRGAEGLRALGLSGLWLLVAFVGLTALLDLLVGSASAKWAFMAPIFVPMLMHSGLSPEAVQAGYRVGDSVANIVSPLLPYLPIIIVFARRYEREAGLGTLLAMMLPYSLAFGVAWTALLLAWVGLGLPLGPGVPAGYP